MKSELTYSERFVFVHFFDWLALAGAFGQWIVACWILAGFGIVPPGPLHAIVPCALAVVIRIAARRLEREPAVGPLSGPSGYVVLAGAFTGMACAAALGLTTAAWATGRLLGALPVEAGLVLAAPVRDPFFGPVFHAIASAVVVSTAAIVAHGYARGYRRLVVTRLELPIEGLPPALAGLRLVHVSDIHLGPVADRAALRAAFARVAALDPDIVCVTGDIVDSPATDLASWVPELARVWGHHGVFAILGNHDRHVGPGRVAAALAGATDWRVLRDQVATVEIGGARLHLLGLEDRPESEVADGLPALLARVPAGEPAILLAHRPTVFPAAAAAGVPLTLAGHTHGGQVAVPGAPGLNVARLLMTRFDAGVFTHAGAVMNVSRGLGTGGQRVRVGVPAEITVLTLVPAVAAADARAA